MDRHVAIKVLPPHPGQDVQFVERFRLEARTIARLQHPYILPLYDYGNQDDILYLVMPYVEGGTLRDLIEQGPVRLADVEAILRQVSSALDYAHKNGMIHRDIKPDNILMSREGDALLADFGITKLSDDFEAVLPQATTSTELSAFLVEGVDLNGNRQVEPFEGECSLSQIQVYGVSVGSMTLNEGPPPAEQNHPEMP